MSQTQFINNVIDRFDVEMTSPILDLKYFRRGRGNAEPAVSRDCRSLLWIDNQTGHCKRCLAVAQHSHDPTAVHSTATCQILAYLTETGDLILIFHYYSDLGDMGFNFELYGDEQYASKATDKR